MHSDISSSLRYQYLGTRVDSFVNTFQDDCYVVMVNIDPLVWFLIDFHDHCPLSYIKQRGWDTEIARQ